MKLQITRTDVWHAGMKDRPGGLNVKLTKLAEAGVNLEFLIARRSPKKPGTGVVFVTPIKGPKQLNAAKKAGFKKSKSIFAVRVACSDRAGLGALLTAQIASAGINMRGASAASIGKKAIFNFAFGSTADAAKAVRALKKL